MAVGPRSCGGAAARGSKQVGDDEMQNNIRWIPSYIWGRAEQLYQERSAVATPRAEDDAAPRLGRQPRRRTRSSSQSLTPWSCGPTPQQCSSMTTHACASSSSYDAACWPARRWQQQHLRRESPRRRRGAGPGRGNRRRLLVPAPEPRRGTWVGAGPTRAGIRACTSEHGGPRRDDERRRPLQRAHSGGRRDDRSAEARGAGYVHLAGRLWKKLITAQLF